MSHSIICIRIRSISAGGDNPIAGVLAKGHCLVSKGGLRHVKGHTWYEVKLVDGTVREQDLRHCFIIYLSTHINTNKKTTLCGTNCHVYNDSIYC